MAARPPRRRRGSVVIVAVTALILALPAARGATAQPAPATPLAPGPVTEPGAGDRDGYVPAPTFTRPPAATFSVTYGTGFPAEARPAVQAALDVWSGLITSGQPIAVSALWEAVGGLGRADVQFHRDFAGAPLAGTWYPRPLAEALSGMNLGGTEPDIVIRIPPRADWYYGTDGNTPAAQFDLMTIVLHEVLHGLGMLGSMTVASGQGSWGLGTGLPLIFDRFTEDNTGNHLINTTTYPNPSVALANALQSGRLWFDSPQTNRGNGDRIRLHSPNPWTGSSYQHFDETVYPTNSANSLATPTFFSSEAVHVPGPLPLCMLEALGWTTTANCVPPAVTSVSGFTWFADGSPSGTGPTGSQIRAYATGANPGRSYKLVSGLDGGSDRPCMWEVVPINPNVRVASGAGVIGITTGTLNRDAGRWDVCFREEGTGNTLLITVPLTFRVV